MLRRIRLQPAVLKGSRTGVQRPREVASKVVAVEEGALESGTARELDPLGRKEGIGCQGFGPNCELREQQGHRDTRESQRGAECRGDQGASLDGAPGKRVES